MINHALQVDLRRTLYAQKLAGGVWKWHGVPRYALQKTASWMNRCPTRLLTVLPAHVVGSTRGALRKVAVGERRHSDWNRSIHRKCGIHENLKTLEGNEFQVLEVNDSRLDAKLPVRRVSRLRLHYLIRSEI